MYPYLLGVTKISELAALFYLSRVVTPAISSLISEEIPACSPLKAPGYRVKDTWECPESGINLPWHLRHRIKAYVGFLLERG
jgi:hypothetical protein